MRTQETRDPVVEAQESQGPSDGGSATQGCQRWRIRNLSPDDRGSAQHHQPSALLGDETQELL